MLAVIGLILPAAAMNVASTVYGDERSLTGEVTFLMRGVSVMNTTIYVYNILDLGAPLEVNILPMGMSNPIRLIPGNFTAWLYDGNGGHPERQDFPIVLGDNKRVVFIGHCISRHSVHPTPEPTKTPDTCNEVTFRYVDNGPGLPATYIFDNPNSEDKTVYVYLTEDYWYESCPIVGCKPTPTPTPEPTMVPCRNVDTTRALDSSSFAAPPGHVEYSWELPRMQNHIKYNFRVETICS